MYLYSDVISGDELFCMKIVDDTVHEVDCGMVTIKAGVDIDIGVNPSAEEAEDALEEDVKQVNNLVHFFRLQPTSFDKESYVSYIKGYMKAVKAHLEKTNPEHVAAFVNNTTAYVRKIIANFEDYEFYTGGSMNVEGMVALLNYRKGGIPPTSPSSRTVLRNNNSKLLHLHSYFCPKALIKAYSNTYKKKEFEVT